MKTYFLAALILSGVPAMAAPTEAKPTDLEKELKTLELPANTAPSGMRSEEQIYSVQTRYSPLRLRHEVNLGASKNFTPDSFLSSNELSLAYRFHISDRFNLTLGGSYVFNSMSGSGKELYAQTGVVPDLAYPKMRGEFLIGYNLFYGKFRLGMESNLYFDMYVAIGPGYTVMDRANAWGGVGDIGFAFWIGKWGTMRLGVKDHYHLETRRFSEGWSHNALAHLDIGILFGGPSGDSL